MFQFFLSYWTPIVATISFVSSTYLLILNWFRSRTHIKFDEISLHEISAFESIFLITITNKSSQPIAITNASLDSKKLIRASHRRFIGNNFYAYTSEFPINLKPNETKEILMEFEVSFMNDALVPDKTLTLITSKKPVKTTISTPGSKTTPSQLAKVTTKVRKEQY